MKKINEEGAAVTAKNEEAVEKLRKSLVKVIENLKTQIITYDKGAASALEYAIAQKILALGADADTAALEKLKETAVALKSALEDLKESSEDIFTLAKIPDELFEDLEEFGEAEAAETISAIQIFMKKLRKAELEEAREAAETIAGEFTSRFIDLMEGNAKDFEDFFKNLGRTIVSQMLEAMLTEFLISNIAGITLKGAAGGGGIGKILGGGLLDLFKGIFKFGKGGMVLPKGTVQQFQHGGVVRGPTLGVIGEEGPEIVARMKPAREQDKEKPLVIHLWDQRPRGVRPGEVIQIVGSDMDVGGRTSRGVETVLRRNR